MECDSILVKQSVLDYLVIFGVTLATSILTALIVGPITAAVGHVTVSGDLAATVVGIASATILILLYLKRRIDGMEYRTDLLARMMYQTPFVETMQADPKEHTKYVDSLLRKLDDVGKYRGKFGDLKFCSYYVGCLSFLSTEARGKVPWDSFRDRLISNFSEEIVDGRLSPHVIREHWGEDKYNDLLRRAQARSSSLVTD